MIRSIHLCRLNQNSKTTWDIGAPYGAILALKIRGLSGKTKLILHQPGIEPRANAWKAFMLPLHHWCL